MKSFSFLLLLFLVSSCALDKLFLHPYPLSTESSFSAYVEEYKDTLTMKFTGDMAPYVMDSKEEPVDLSYHLENIFFQNSNGDNINGWLFKPKEYNGTTLYFLHGNAANMVYQYGLATPFVEKGFQVFMIDYSGFGFSDGKSKRKNVLIDGMDGFDYLLSRKDLHWDKLLVYGQSLGGHLATVVAEKNQSKIDGLIIEGAFSSHSDIAAEMVPVLGRIFTREQYSAKKVIDNINKPVLIIHSNEDKTVPYANGQRLFENATEPKKLLTIDNLHIRGPLFHLDTILTSMEVMFN